MNGVKEIGVGSWGTHLAKALAWAFLGTITMMSDEKSRVFMKYDVNVIVMPKITGRVEAGRLPCQIQLSSAGLRHGPLEIAKVSIHVFDTWQLR